MMRSMFASVSGLRAHQTRMDVIGNNIANVNTLGYRASRVTFKEVFSQTLAGAGSPDTATGKGGTNPLQIGLGMGLSAIDTITTRGSLQRTDSPTDISIEGDGFFIVKAGSNDTPKFTRAGNFTVDKLGNLVGPGGYNVYGWQDYGGAPNADGMYEFDTEQEIEPINIYEDTHNLNKRIIAAKVTENAVFAGNLDATEGVVATTTDPQFIVPFTVYDELGNEFKINVNFWKTAIGATTPPTTTWSWSATGDGTPTGATGNITFLSNGKIDTTVAASVKPTITVNPTGTGSAAFDVDLDFTKLSMYAADSSVKPTNVDGYETGSLVTFSIGSDGILTGVYSNGQQQPLGIIAMATFENPAGLERVGNNLFLPSTNSGDFKRAYKPGSEGVGTLNPGTLEMSNVDLSAQFTEMIVTQRGFQANSRIMTSVDEMLQELVNLKR